MTIEERLRLLADRVGRLELEIGLVAPEGSERCTPANPPMAMTVILDQIRARIDQLHLRADALAGRTDILQARSEARLERLEVELRELPSMIERGMRAVLREEADGK